MAPSKKLRKRSWRQIFLDTLSALGGPEGNLVTNADLRSKLGWDEHRYRRIKDQLRAEGLVDRHLAVWRQVHRQVRRRPVDRAERLERRRGQVGERVDLVHHPRLDQLRAGPVDNRLLRLIADNLTEVLTPTATRFRRLRTG